MSELVFVLSGALVMLFAFLIILPQVETNSHAEGEATDEGIVIVFSPEIDVSLKSSDDGYYKIVKDTVEISTSSQNGYTLYLSTDTAEHQDIYLNGDASSSSKISGTSGTYESPKPLEDYTWGWAVPGMSHFNDSYDTDNPSADAKFAATPLSNQIIRDYIEPATGDTAEVYYGFKLGGELETGNYETNIIYTAIPATQPLTAKAVLGDNGNFNFLYDRKNYTAGETYTDNIGETTITNIYSVSMEGIAETDSWPWIDQKDSILTANFDDSFVNARPTSMARWFRDLHNLGAITNHQNLNTSMVQTMYQAFAFAGHDIVDFSFDLSGWDTSNVTDMSYVFARAGESSTTFNLNIAGWDTSSATSFFAMFYRTGFSATTWSIGDIGGWNTSNVTNFSAMFNRGGNSATTFNIGNLDNWNTSNATDMSMLFGQAGQNATVWNVGDLSKWDTGNVTDMSWMFNQTAQNATVWNVGDLSKWNTSNVTAMRDMFWGSAKSASTWDIGNLNYVDEENRGWDVSGVTDHYGFVDWDQTNIDPFKLPWQSD